MPTLNLSPATSSLLPALLGGTPAAPAPAGDGLGEAFAAMLAGLTMAPDEALAASAAPALPATGTSLPQVRQDPAAWLPDEEAPASTPLTPAAAFSPGPADTSPLVVPPDCEMQAFDPVLPQTADPAMPQPADPALPQTVDPALPQAAAPALPQTDDPVQAAPAAMPGVIQAPPKFWPLRLSSALTPARFSVPADKTESVSEQSSTEGPDQPAPSLAVAAPIVAAPPILAAVDVPAQPPPPAPDAEAVAVAARPDRDAPAPTTPITAASRSEAPAAVPAQTMPAAPDRQPQHQQQPQGQPHPQSAQPGPTIDLAPELLKQVAQTIEAVRAPAQTADALPAEPTQPIVAAPTPAPVAIAQPQPVPATAQPSQPAPVDVGRAEWVQAMVDRIAELPQLEGGREAQIKLVPDRLGKVEVSIVHRDEQVQVTLNAETAQARQLLSDAAPRLQELAEARGLRLTQTEVGGGQPQDRRSPHDQQQPHTPQRPRPASAERDAEPQTPGDLIA